MQTESTPNAELMARKPKNITVTINERPVTFTKHKATGLEIKQTAIQQGITIQEDFVLFEIRGNSPLKQIGDCETIVLHENQKFCATAPDDNS